MSLLHLFRTPFLSNAQSRDLIGRTNSLGLPPIASIETESCFNIQVSSPLTEYEKELLSWLLRETFDPDQFGSETFLSEAGPVLEVGPRMNFSTAWSTNAGSICRACGLDKIERIERSRRYLLGSDDALDGPQTESFLNLVHDRMTECYYPQELTSFDSGVTPEATFDIPLIEEGMAALVRINKEMGLAFDDRDLEYYTDLFLDHIKRNPTNVECFDIAQSNSEHSRHWFFKGRLIVDGVEIPNHLIEMIQEPLKRNPSNSVIAFSDNSSAIKGYRINTLLPQSPGSPGPMLVTEKEYHALFTAETHNFPSGVAPFPGAETGTGGRIRDVHAAGRGSLVVAGTAAYCVGNLHIPGYELPWEDREFKYPQNLATPLQIEIEASNGASDYGNKFGEPLIQGYTRAFGLRLPGGERREWIKPIMFSGGIGQIDATHTKKREPEKDMWVVKLGGPAYRIGMGGGAASSMVQGENAAELDFNAVQRGDAEMEQKVNRVIRACVELGDANPIVSIHDQGAGGSCNVLKEIVEPEGARIDVRAMPVGDHTLSVLEIWGAEYQEQDALLLRPEHVDLFTSLCKREKVQCAFVGRITGDGKIVLYDETDGSTPVDLDLDKVLGDMPQKTFEMDRVSTYLEPVVLPQGLTVKAALDRVLRLVSVGSKRFLTNKVDRSVTGLVARQQCVGPLQLTAADVAVIAQSHFGLTGAATAIGEQPIIGLIEPAAMARMSLGEALTNLVWAQVSALEHVKCSGNWMWAAKLPGEGAALYDAADALCKMLIELGIAIDGGKDSLSMAALAPGLQGQDETVKAPGALVISAYVTCPDIAKTVTPDLKLKEEGRLLYVDLGCGNHRVGGSSLAQVYNQVGQETPDVNDSKLLKRAFTVVQTLISQGLISAGHDRSDGGLITTLLEMAFSGNCGLQVNLQDPDLTDPIRLLFAEELGLVLEVHEDVEQRVLKAFSLAQVPCVSIGKATVDFAADIKLNGVSVLEGDTRELRDLWEETSFHLEALQANPRCVEQEREGLRGRTSPAFVVPFKPRLTESSLLQRSDKPRVAIVREEGSNGDREMASAFHSAGFEAWDVTMSDLLNGEISLDSFRGMVFVGGFSYADVLDSAKGWAGVIRFNTGLWQQFQRFYSRADTFSLGVCNGCQLMALLGWIPWQGIADELQPRFIHNASGRFESRFSTVQIQKSPAIMFDGMVGATLGIWVAHGEGRAYFPDSEMFTRILDQRLAPVRYVDDLAAVTESYPFNPNGSPEGIAALCSPDGRHLAMMPHPERTFLKWQWGWMPNEWKTEMDASPWLRMFQNARKWCDGA
jgi:phosphoribosylformylglycinamidine synthase